MREIYILNKGDSIDKIKYEYPNLKNNNVSDNTIFGYKFVELNNDYSNIVVVKNYLPYYEYKVDKNENIMDIMARGYKVIQTNSVQTDDIILISKPKSIRYVTKPLETIDDIANNFGVETKYLMEINNLKSKKLFVGQILWI